MVLGALMLALSSYMVEPAKVVKVDIVQNVAQLQAR